MIKQLNNQLYFGLIGISITIIVTQNAFAMERLERVVIGSSKFFMRSLHGSRMHARLYSSTINPNPDIDLTEEWNKGWVPNVSCNKAEFKESSSPTSLVDGHIQVSSSSTSHAKQHESFISSEWIFNPTRSLCCRREYYNREELKKSLNSTSTQKLQPAEIDTDTVKFSIDKTRKD